MNTILVHSTPNGDELIAKMARVSNPSNEDNHETAPKLINYLMKQQQEPFEMATMCVEIHTTRSVAAQLLRHKSMFFQEFPQRYANTNELGSKERHICVDKTKRTGKTRSIT